MTHLPRFGKCGMSCSTFGFFTFSNFGAWELIAEKMSFSPHCFDKIDQREGGTGILTCAVVLEAYYSREGFGDRRNRDCPANPAKPPPGGSARAQQSTEATTYHSLRGTLGR